MFSQQQYWEDELISQVALKGDLDDYKSFLVTHQHISSVSGVHHIYLQQSVGEIPLIDGVLSLHFDKQKKLITYHDRFVKDLKEKVYTPENMISSEEAVFIVFSHFDFPQKTGFEVISRQNNGVEETQYRGTESFFGNIISELIYLVDSTNQLRLCRQVKFETSDGLKNIVAYVDVENGQIKRIQNLVIECSFLPEHAQEHHRPFFPLEPSLQTEENVYHVFPLKSESPSHSGRMIISGPAHPEASPFGWHDTDGFSGYEFTETKGNNVEAREDRDGINNTPGQMADGGPSLVFDFPLIFSLPPDSSQDASITNLFYWNNIIHDIFYLYGFDEEAGNFQTNNYGNGGLQNDHVRAEAMDGGGLNNANFFTPVDGNPPRMQMYLWSGPSVLTVSSPPNIAGNYGFSKASFGPSAFSISEEIVLVNDGSATPTLACVPIINGSSVNGKIAMIDRGGCEFGSKCLRAQNAGAIAVIVCNNVSGAPFAMGPGADGSSVTIPCIMMSQQNCDSIKLYLNQGVEVSFVTGINIDGDYDNAIITHEYGHGISIRLTGGAGNSSCLNNNEQMGEGWSDWFGLMLTMEPDDTESRARGIGTYALNQPVTGPGIRPFRYSTDMTVNPQTYQSITTAAVPHGVGSVWCSMLWELTWAFIREYGYDEDLYSGSGGNNKVLTLVTEALKLQPCLPGFVDGRNAILLADSVLFGGVNNCLIWKAFAKRGLGFSASQGLSSSVFDGVQAFDMPPFCCTYVSNHLNSGNGSLRDAIDCATDGDTIRFLNFVMNDTIELENNALVVDKSILISHPEPWLLTLKSTGSFPVFNIQSQTKLENLNITGGMGPVTRCILNNSSLTLQNIKIEDRDVNLPGGQGILNHGNIIVQELLILNED